MLNPKTVSNPGNPLYRRRSDFRPRHLRQRRFVGVVSAIATLVFAYGLWAH